MISEHLSRGQVSRRCLREIWPPALPLSLSSSQSTCPDPLGARPPSSWLPSHLCNTSSHKTSGLSWTRCFPFPGNLSLSAFFRTCCFSVFCLLRPPPPPPPTPPPARMQTLRVESCLVDSNHCALSRVQFWSKYLVIESNAGAGLILPRAPSSRSETQALRAH